jgi:hypothetical protein
MQHKHPGDFIMIGGRSSSFSCGKAKLNNHSYTMTVTPSSRRPPMVLNVNDDAESIASLRTLPRTNVRFSDSSIHFFPLEENCTYYGNGYTLHPREDDLSQSPIPTTRSQRSPPPPRVRLSWMGRTNRRRRVRKLLADDMIRRCHQQQC